jgi:cytochrome P450
MMNLFSEEMRRDPYPAYDQLRSSSPLLHFAPADLWLILDHDGVKRALHDHDAFSSSVSQTRGVSFEWFLFMDPPRHTKLRGLINRAFTPGSVASLEPRIRELSRELLDRVIERGEMDFCADFAVPLPMMVIAEMIGLPTRDWPHLARWSDAIVALGNTIVGSPEAAKAASDQFNAADAEMRAYLGGLFVERRAAPREDLLTRLILAEVDGERLTEGEIVRFLQLLLAAGTETTSNLLSNAVLCLLENPAELARLQAAPELLPQAIEEVLRHRSPVQAMFRAARRDVEMHGQVIPAGKLVIAVIGSGNRDPQHFTDPGRFDITRDPNPHIAFGHGIHFCLGAPLSRLEARIALPDFLSRAKGFARASDEPWQPRSAFHVHGPTRLPLRFDPGKRA